MRVRSWQWITQGLRWWAPQRWRPWASDKGPILASPHVSCFVTWLLHCTHRRRFLLVAMLLLCPALPLYPQRTNGPAPVADANAKALQLPLPPKPGWPVSPVL